ncbi:MAG: hypothetical protein H0U49_02205 [Parachlamydiaceae bacterium]|nr:hypothetical protein [Parachlamydiaceae bacterium]
MELVKKIGKVLEKLKNHRLRYSKSVLPKADIPSFNFEKKKEKAVKVHKNALNQKDNREYQYKAKDIAAIADSLTVKDEFKDCHFIQPVDIENVNIDEIISKIQDNKPALCVFNINNLHWIAFSVFKEVDGSYVVMYKDSLGKSNEGLRQLFEINGRKVQFIHHAGYEQTIGLECGIFALENLRRMAKELGKDKDAFIQNFNDFKFCSLEMARRLRSGDFATFYNEGIEVQQAEELEKISRRIALRQKLHVEAIKIAEEMQKFDTRLFVQALSTEENFDRNSAVNAVVVEVGLDSDLSNPHYRIYTSKDLDINMAINLLKHSFGEKNYIVEDNVIKIQAETNIKALFTHDTRYLSYDVERILSAPTLQKEFKDFHLFKSLLDTGAIFSKLEDGKPVLCVYDWGKWLALCIFRNDDGTYTVLYMNYNSPSNELLKKLFCKKDRCVKFIPHLQIESNQDYSASGAQAIQNLRIMAQELSKGRDAFVESFGEFEFCSVESANELKKGEFADFYKEGDKVFETEKLAKIDRLHQIKKKHYPEIQNLAEDLKKLGEGFSVRALGQNDSVEKNAKKTIALEIEVDRYSYSYPSVCYNYNLKIYCSNDLEMIVVEELLKKHSQEKYEIKDGVLRICRLHVNR